MLPEREAPEFVKSVLEVPRTVYGFGVSYEPLRARYHYAYFNGEGFVWLNARGTHKDAQILFRTAYLGALSDVISLCNDLQLFEYSQELLKLFGTTETELRELMTEDEDDDG